MTYEERLKEARAKARIWDGKIMMPEVPEHRDELTGLTARDEERRWRDQARAVLVFENIYQ
jgi:hypothetical protein